MYGLCDDSPLRIWWMGYWCSTLSSAFMSIGFLGTCIFKITTHQELRGWVILLLLCRLQYYMGNISELLRNFSKSIKLLQGSRILHYMSIDRWWILTSASLILFRMDNQSEAWVTGYNILCGSELKLCCRHASHSSSIKPKGFTLAKLSSMKSMFPFMFCSFLLFYTVTIE